MTAGDAGPEAALVPLLRAGRGRPGRCAMERKMFEKVLGRGLRLSQCRLDGHRSCDFEAKPSWSRTSTGRLSRLTVHAVPRPHRSRPDRGRRLDDPSALNGQETDEQGSQDRQPARGHRRQGDPQGGRPHDPPGRSPCPDGAERLGQEHAELRPDGPPELRSDRGHGDARRHDLLELEADERAKAGLFLAFQYPTSIPASPSPTSSATPSPTSATPTARRAKT